MANYKKTMTDALLPDRHPQKDFFIPDIFDSLPFKSDKHTMEHPFFALTTRKDVRSVRYNKNGVDIMFRPHPDSGLPTIFDKDILLYCGSQIMAEINKGKIPPKKLRFHCHDLLVSTNRHTNGVGYEMLKNAFERLTSCYIETNIRTSEVCETKGFHLIDSFHIVTKTPDDTRMVKVEVGLADWFYYALLDKQVLTLHRDYFRLRKPLERRLYELARKHCGNQPSWSIRLENLHEKCGSQSVLKKFRLQVKKIIETDEKEDHFPEYRFSLSKNDVIIFSPKKAKKEQTEEVLEAIPQLSERAKENARKLCIKARTGWDYYSLESDFIQELKDGFKPDNVNGAFINFVKKKVAHRP